MRKITVFMAALAVAGFTACGGGDDDDATREATTTTAEVTTTTTVPAVAATAAPTTTAAPAPPRTTVAPAPAAASAFTLTASTADRTSKRDGAIAADGVSDKTFTAAVSGPVSDFVIFGCTPDQKVSGRSQWDTIPDAEPQPDGFYYTGRSAPDTWQIAVTRNGALLNGADGGIPTQTLPAGTTLELTVSDDGAIGSGSGLNLCLAVMRPDGTRSVTRA